jgi:hypothetical protein
MFFLSLISICCLERERVGRFAYLAARPLTNF